MNKRKETILINIEDFIKEGIYLFAKETIETLKEDSNLKNIKVLTLTYV